MYYYYCQVEQVVWKQEKPASEEWLEIHYETLEITKERYDEAIRAGEMAIDMPGLEHYTDEFLNTMCTLDKPVFDLDKITRH